MAGARQDCDSSRRGPGTSTIRYSGSTGMTPTYLARGRISCSVAYCSIACPIHPTLRPMANRIIGAPAGSSSTRAVAASAKSMFGHSPVLRPPPERTQRRTGTRRISHTARREGPAGTLARGSPSRYNGCPKPSIDSPRRSRALTAAPSGRACRIDSSIDSTRALAPPCFGPSNAARPARTTA